MKDLINRKKYTVQIKPFINKSLIKVLIGQRRVGKSYILYQLMEEIRLISSNPNIIYINKEDIKFDFIENYSDLIEYINTKKQNNVKNYIFIDEIQEIQSFEKALRSLQLGEEYDIYCTGSNANLLSSEIATLLSGRYIQIKVHSLSYLEFLKFHHLKNTNESLYEYINYGGMPYLINLKKNDDIYREYLLSLIDSIILKDIVERYGIRDISFLKNIIYFVCDNIGSIISSKKISDYMKSQKYNTSTKKVIEYLDYLTNVFFINKVKRSEVGGKKIFEIGEKYFIEDLGMRHALLPFNIRDIGKVMENLIYHHLKINNYQIFIGKLDDKEIDFVISKNNIIIYLQVAYLIKDETTFDREFGNLLKIKDNYRKIVISFDQIESKPYKGIEHWTLRRFLTKFE